MASHLELLVIQTFEGRKYITMNMLQFSSTALGLVLSEKLFSVTTVGSVLHKIK